MRIYIEQRSAKPAWLALGPAERGAFLEQVGPDLQGVLDQGAELVALVEADPSTDRSAEHDYVAVWRFPTLELVHEFERGIEKAGWYDYFEQVNVGGEAVAFDALLARLATV